MGFGQVVGAMEYGQARETGPEKRGWGVAQLRPVEDLL